MSVVEADLDVLSTFVGDGGKSSRIELAYALYLRAAVTSKLAQQEVARARALLPQAEADVESAVEVLLEFALAGEADLRLELTEAIHRWVCILQQNGPPTDDRLAAAERTLVRCLPYVDPGDGVIVPTMARLSNCLALVAPEVGADATADTGDLLRRAERWRDRAVELYGSPDRQVSWESVQQLASAAANVHAAILRTSKSGAGQSLRRLSESANRAFQCLSLVEARSHVAPADPDGIEAANVLASCREALFGNVALAANDAWGLLASTSQGDDHLLLMSAQELRAELHRLDERIWTRASGAAELAEVLQAKPSSASDKLQHTLDLIELEFVRLTFAVAEQYLRSERLLPDVLDQEASALLVEAVATWALSFEPPVSPAHIVVATSLMSQGAQLESMSLSELQVDIEARAATLRLDQPGGAVPDDLDQMRARRLLDQLVTRRHELASQEWLSDLGEVVDRVLAVSDVDLEWSSEFATYVLLCAYMARPSAEREELEATVALADRAQHYLRSHGEHRPVVEVARSAMLKRLAQSDPAAYTKVAEAAGAIVAYLSAQSSLSTEGILSLSTLVDNLHSLALARLVAAESGEEPARAEVQELLDHLDRIVGELEDGELRSRAERHQEEISVMAQGLSEPKAPFTDANVELRPGLFLRRLLTARPPMEPREFRDQIDDALDSLLRHVARAGSLSASQVNTFLPFVSAEAASALGLTVAQRMRLLHAAADAFSSAQPDTAVQVLWVMNTACDLRLSAEGAHQYNVLCEEIAARFLPAAVRADDQLEHVALFLYERVETSQNQGAVSSVELASRRGVALAAHLLAVSDEQADLAAMSAYLLADLSRLLNDSARAHAWYRCYDQWLAAGALAHEKYSESRRAIELDRAELNTLAIPDGA